jgi:hypothetical protein
MLNLNKNGTFDIKSGLYNLYNIKTKPAKVFKIDKNSTLARLLCKIFHIHAYIIIGDVKFSSGEFHYRKENKETTIRHKMCIYCRKLKTEVVNNEI